MKGRDAAVSAGKDAEIAKLTAENEKLAAELRDLRAVVDRFQIDIMDWRRDVAARDKPKIEPAQEWTECPRCADAYQPDEGCIHSDPRCPMVKR
jgi:Mn-dependent DtxR family transcriptional regulator